MLPRRLRRPGKRFANTAAGYLETLIIPFSRRFARTTVSVNELLTQQRQTGDAELGWKVEHIACRTKLAD
jgi:hypothetical protein